MWGRQAQAPLPQHSPQVLPVALVSGAEGGVCGGQAGPLEKLWGQLCWNPGASPKTLSKIFKLNIYTANSVFLPVWTGGGSQMGPGDVGRQNAEKWERSRLGARGQRSGERRWRPGIIVCPLSLLGPGSRPTQPEEWNLNVFLFS